jgi:hypothetical protein
MGLFLATTYDLRMRLTSQGEHAHIRPLMRTLAEFNGTRDPKINLTQVC